MSFKCAQCGEPKRQGHMVVTETRQKDYFEERTIGHRLVEVPVGSGYETVHEERVCTDCLDEAKKNTIVVREGVAA